jgi:hypothetical protein
LELIDRFFGGFGEFVEVLEGKRGLDLVAEEHEGFVEGSETCGYGAKQEGGVGELVGWGFREEVGAPGAGRSEIADGVEELSAEV